MCVPECVNIVAPPMSDNYIDTFRGGAHYKIIKAVDTEVNSCYIKIKIFRGTMFYRILYLLSFTLFVDFILLLGLFIYSNVRILKKKILKINFFLCITLFFSTLWIISCILSILEIKKDSICQKVFSSDTLYSCYIAVLVGAITVFFTVFAFIKPKKMTFTNYQKYVLSCKTKFFYSSILFVFTIDTVLIFIHIDNLFFRIALVSSIFLIISALIKSIFELNCMENEEIANSLFVGNVCRSILKNKTAKKKNDNVGEYALTLFKEYLLPCFEDNCFRVAFEKSEQFIINKYNSNTIDLPQLYYDFSAMTLDIYKWYLDTYLRRIFTKERKSDLINNVMQWITEINLHKILVDYKSNTKDEQAKTIGISQSLYEIWFKLYRLLITTDINNIKFPFILNGVEPLSFGIVFYEQDGKYVTEEYINLYKYYLREAYQICVISLYHSDYRIFKRFLQDYVFTIQLLKYNYKYNEIIKTQNFYLLVIGTYIANRLQEGMLSKKFMKLIVPLIKELEYVRISYDSFIYDEPLSLTGMQTRFKDFHYYCVLLFLYALSQLKTGNEKTEFINELIHKIERTENEPFVFETILRILSEKRDFELFNGDDISLLEKACETKVEKKEKNEFAELQKAVNSMPKEVLEYIVKQDIEKFEEHFNYCGLNNNDSELIKLPSGFVFIHSGKYLTGKSTYDIFGIYSHFDLIDDWIYSIYIKKSTVKFVSTIDDILNDNSTYSHITLICPIKYHIYFRTMKNITYDAHDIIYKGIKITIETNHSCGQYIIVKNILKNYVSTEKLSQEKLLQTMEIKKDEHNKSVDILFPYAPLFYIRSDSNMKIYSIVGINEEENTITYKGELT